MAPPLVGVAVNVTDVPEQILFAETEVVTVGVLLGLTITVITLLFAIGVVIQLALLVNITLTWSLVLSVLLVNVLLFEPTLDPFTCH